MWGTWSTRCVKPWCWGLSGKFHAFEGWTILTPWSCCASRTISTSNSGGHLRVCFRAVTQFWAKGGLQGTERNGTERLEKQSEPSITLCAFIAPSMIPLADRWHCIQLSTVPVPHWLHGKQSICDPCIALRTRQTWDIPSMNSYLATLRYR